MEFKRFSPFIEKYEYKDININYRVVDFYLVKKKSEWKFTDINVAPHPMAIS